MTTHRMITLAAAVLALVGVAGPAHADADVTDGRVSLTVHGHGVRVDRVDGWLTGRHPGARARLYTVYQGSRTDLTAWKRARVRSAGRQRIMQATWTPHRRLPQGAWLCVQYDGADGDPCARIHR
ncbi:hypothetical protein [Streptomyces griseofuscus]|uniref:hypothetical protein n=1 Tax=Streptomyces griseofuscus TaxID=146922 RepID=UPI0033E752EA